MALEYDHLHDHALLNVLPYAYELQIHSTL